MKNKLLKYNWYNNNNNMNKMELEKILREASEIYYNTGKKIISDEEFDELKEKLSKIDPNNKFLKEVGAKVRGKKVKLPYVSGSLNKIKNISKWMNDYIGPYLVTDKLDGTSGIVEIKNDRYYLYKRGDGIYGTDISHILEYIKLPKITNENNNIVIRGELMISKKDFETLDMSNARSAVNGLVNSKTINKTVAKITHFIAHSIQYPQMKACDQITKLVELGYETPYSVVMNTLDNLENLLDTRRKLSSYEIDGLVITDCSKIYISNELFPSHSFAFKTINEIVTANVEKVLWTASKNKYLKPVIVIEPIIINGTTITNITAFNAKYIIDNGIGKGSVVEIIKAGDVIPHILSVKKSVSPDLPQIPYTWNDSHVDLISIDENTESITAKILYFFKTIGVKNLGEKLIEKLVENDYDDILKILKAKKKKLIEIEGIGEKLVDKIYQNIEDNLKEIERFKLMTATGIFGRNFGIKKLELILNEYPNIDTMSQNELIDVISNLKGFSLNSAKQFAENLSEYLHFENKLINMYDIKFKNINNNSSKRNVVFTGFRDQKLKEYVETIGDIVTDNITKKTDLVVYNDETNKLKKAKEMNIQIMTLDEYKKSLR